MATIQRRKAAYANWSKNPDEWDKDRERDVEKFRLIVEQFDPYNLPDHVPKPKPYRLNRPTATGLHEALADLKPEVREPWEKFIRDFYDEGEYDPRSRAGATDPVIDGGQGLVEDSGLGDSRAAEAEDEMMAAARAAFPV
mmetsp:Transcript_25065/g.48964  ORF Transcript_25065/g.48964 Transcript_25065/m.48964 type:complete len:140 (+) Transcript_25065:1-420(+)